MVDNYRTALRNPEEAARAVAYHVTPIRFFLNTVAIGVVLCVYNSFRPFLT